MTGIYLHLQNVQSVLFNWSHLDLWQRIHIVADSDADRFANVLYIIKTSDDVIVVKAEEKRTSQTVGKGAHAFESTFGFVSFKHHLEIVCRTSPIRVFKSIFTAVVMFAYAVFVYQRTKLQHFIKAPIPHRHNSLENAIKHIRVDNADLIAIFQESTYLW